MLISLLYISASRIDPAVAEDMVAAIVDECRPRNQERGLSGALIYTGTHFAQIIEGDAEAVDRLLVTLRADVRHADLMVVDRRPIDARRFPEWSMAYSGPSQFIGRQVNRLLNDPSPAELRRAVVWLSDLMYEFVSR